MRLRLKLEHIDWESQSNALDTEGYAVIKNLLSVKTCAALSAKYHDPNTNFRAIVNMARYNFGKGEYKYFDYPLPPLVADLREQFYPPLAKIANRWAKRTGEEVRWPNSLEKMTARCHRAAQKRPTPLLLDYAAGDYNCLHQDLYGEIHFPLQIVVLLSEPDIDFTGGEFTLVEQRPRMQSRPMIVPLKRGDAAIIPVRERPNQGKNRVHRVQLRHGVSKIRSGNRRALGIIFHDAA